MRRQKIQSVIKVGNSLAVTLPPYLTRAMKIFRGDSVVLGCVQDDVIYIHKVRDEDLPEYDVKVIDFNS